MSLFDWFRRPRTATDARERLKVVLAHDRGDGRENPQLVALLQEDIMAVIAKRMHIDRDKVTVKLNRGDDYNTLEIDIEIPAAMARA